MSDETPKIQVDTDWKAQAQAEKERLVTKEREQAEKAAEEGGPEGRALPEASFKALMGTLASQALMGLGTMGDPKTGRIVVDLEGSQFAIDLLQILEETTTGNISEEDAGELKQVLTELRARFVQLTQMVAEQQAAGAVAGAGVPISGSPAAGAPPAPPGIIMPD